MELIYQLPPMGKVAVLVCRAPKGAARDTPTYGVCRVNSRVMCQALRSAHFIDVSLACHWRVTWQGFAKFDAQFTEQTALTRQLLS
jgi:hypothetical protein